MAGFFRAAGRCRDEALIRAAVDIGAAEVCARATRVDSGAVRWDCTDMDVAAVVFSFQAPPEPNGSLACYPARWLGRSWLESAVRRWRARGVPMPHGRPRIGRWLPPVPAREPRDIPPGSWHGGRQIHEHLAGYFNGGGSCRAIAYWAAHEGWTNQLPPQTLREARALAAHAQPIPASAGALPAWAAPPGGPGAGRAPPGGPGAGRAPPGGPGAGRAMRGAIVLSAWPDSVDERCWILRRLLPPGFPVSPNWIEPTNFVG